MVSPISQERLKQVLHYDNSTGLFTWLRGRPGCRAGSPAGSSRDPAGYIRIMIDRHGYLAHRLAWLYMTGEWPEMYIDHKDTNRSNNCWSNLRKATNAENQYNSVAHKNNQSGFKGASKSGKRWSSKLVHDGERHYLGRFDTAEEAHAAYADNAEIINGEFARAS
jgi:hypothetical protein